MLRVHVLGSGDAFNGGGALHSCYLVEHDTGTILLECGPSVLAAMKREHVPTDVPDAVLISHLHGDHFGGIPFLFLEYAYMNPRSRPLVIAGPPTTASRVKALTEALYADVRGCRHIEFPLEYLEVRPGQRFELAGMNVEAFQVPHSAEPFCLGYRIVGGGGTLLFSGDSAWTDAFAERSRDTDVFLCECCSVDPVSHLHTCYRDIVAHRGELACKRLVLTHLGADVRTSDAIDAELAVDGMVLHVAD